MLIFVFYVLNWSANSEGPRDLWIMVCCLYVGKCFSVLPHHMPHHMVTLAWHTRPHKIRSQIHELQHNHQPEVREAAAIHIKEAQMARNTCPRRILAQHSVPTAVGTSIWAQLQLLLPHHMDAILTNHHCDQQGLLLATHTDVHRHLAGQVDTLCLVGATITIVYITPTQMRVMAQCGAHHAPFLSDPQWPVWRVFQAYLRACATKAGREVPGPKDIATGYKTFQHQHPRPRPSENKTPNDGSTKQKEPIPVSRRLDTTHHPAASTQQAQTRYPHHTVTPCPLVHPQTQHPADQCTTSQTQ